MRGNSLSFTKPLFFLAAFLLVVLFFYFQMWRESSVEQKSSDQSSVGGERLTTIYRNQKIYEDAFAQIQSKNLKQHEALAFVTSHHLLAAPLIAGSYASVRNDVKRIILVSPDHFHSRFSEGAVAFTTTSKWDGIVGGISSDEEFIDKVSRKANNLQIQTKEEPFLSEHGIYTEVPFLAHYFPEARLVPLILKNVYDYQSFKDLGRLLRKESDVSTLLVVSSDFSHNTSKRQANAWDEKSISVLEDLQNGDFENLNNDCRSCIALLAGFLSDTKYSFQLIENKDSTDFGGEDRNVTSYVSGLFTEQKGSPEPPDRSRGKVEVLFGGDMQFDRYIRSVSRRQGVDFLFDGLHEEFQNADLVVANLEGPITDNTSLSEASVEGSRDNYVFTFPSETAALLKIENVKLVNIGNNHILNFKEEGARQTKEFLNHAGVDFFGSPLSGDERTSIQMLSDIRIGFVNYNEFAWKSREKVFEDIRAVKGEVDFLVVYTHWGKEYIPATPEMRTLGREFIDAGADLVIGSHPHVVQAKEAYRGKWIYYSLGNLIFDQYFRPETQTGLVVRAVFDRGARDITLTELPVRLKTNGQTEFLSSENQK